MGCLSYAPGPGAEPTSHTCALMGIEPWPFVCFATAGQGINIS